MPWIKINQDDALPPFVEVQIPDQPTEWLHTVYDLIGCRTIEVAQTVLPGIVLVIDEEGKCFDGWHTRINTIASRIHANPYDPIVGDAILARIQGEDLVPLTQDDLRRLQIS